MGDKFSPFNWIDTLSTPVEGTLKGIIYVSSGSLQLNVFVSCVALSPLFTYLSDVLLDVWVISSSIERFSL